MTALVPAFAGAVLAMALLGSPAAGQEQKAAPKGPAHDIAGIWQGTLKVGAVELRLVTHITKKPDGSYTATLDSLDQGAKDLPVDTITCKDADVHLELKRIKATFEGKMKADGSEIVGDWKQSGLTFALTFKRVAKAPEVRRPQEPTKPYPYALEEVAYENKKAAVKLAGTLTLPRAKGPFAAVLLIPGSGPQDRDETVFGHKPFLVLADYLTRRGMAVLRADDRGVGKSTGERSKATTEDFAGDVQAGVEYLKTRTEINPKQIGLIGHSEGGVIAPLVASRTTDVAFIVLLAGTGLTGEQVLYLQGAAVLKTMGATAEQLAQQRELQELLFRVVREEKDNAAAEKKMRHALAEATAKWAAKDKKAPKELESALEGQVKTLLSPWFRFFLAYDPAVALRKVQCPVLVLNGEKDVQVAARENTEAIEKALKAGGNKDYTIKILPKLNHMFQTCETGAVSEYGKIEETMAPAALEAISDWIGKHTSG